MAAPTIPAWAWLVLAVVLVVSVAIDLYAHRGDHTDSRRRAVLWSIGWIAAALLFNLFVAIRFGSDAGQQFLGAYLLEKSLSLDNLFLFLVIFGALKIPTMEQRRVLTFGIIGAVVTRCLFIFAGAELLQRFHQVTYAFGALLLYTAIKMLRTPEGPAHTPRALGWIERHLPWTSEPAGHHFVTRRDGRLVATPMLVALLAIESADIVFSIDSIPAAFSVSDNTFIIYSANMFAVLGLRALYLVLATSLTRLRYLRFGLSAVLAFAGAKMLASTWIKLSPLTSVAVIATCITISIVASVIARRRADHAEASPLP